MTSSVPPTGGSGGGDSAPLISSPEPGSVQIAQAQNTLDIIKSLIEKLQEQLDNISSSQSGSGGVR